MSDSLVYLIITGLFFIIYSFVFTKMYLEEPVTFGPDTLLGSILCFIFAFLWILTLPLAFLCLVFYGIGKVADGTVKKFIFKKKGT